MLLLALMTDSQKVQGTEEHMKQDPGHSQQNPDCEKFYKTATQFVQQVKFKGKKSAKKTQSIKNKNKKLKIRHKGHFYDSFVQSIQNRKIQSLKVESCLPGAERKKGWGVIT